MRKTILYIEDDHDMKDIVSDIMVYEDYHVITDSGKSMYKILNETTVGLILMDEALSWAWGSDLCYELKEKEETKHIPVVMISAAQEIEEIARRCGAVGYIRKPFDIYDVIDKVNEHYPSSGRIDESSQSVS